MRIKLRFMPHYCRTSACRLGPGVNRGPACAKSGALQEGGRLAQLCLTDLPYNAHIDGHVNGKDKTKHAEFVMASDEMSPAEFASFLQPVLEQVSAREARGRQ